jgi:hypothetical protein
MAPVVSRQIITAKEASENNLDRIALRFGPDLADPIEQNRRCSPATLRILRLRISQRWSEDEMQGVQLILASLLMPLRNAKKKYDRKSNWGDSS